MGELETEIEPAADAGPPPESAAAHMEALWKAIADVDVLVQRTLTQLLHIPTRPEHQV